MAASIRRIATASSREIAAHREGKVPEFVSEYRMRHRNGTLIWMLSRGIAVRDASGKAIRMAGSQTDITEGKIADPLTGLPNRLYFLDRLENSIEATRRKAGLFAVLFLDLDRFKLINDSMGHAAGDELLAETGRRLQLSVDDGELAGGNAGPCVIARLGGDEFAVLLNGIREKTDAIRIAERILRNLEAPFWLSGRQVFASVSIGMALSNSGNSPEDLLRNADTAMYHAKNRGKARLEVFDESMRERALARLEIETELRKAIDTWQLVLYFQPQVALHTGRITGFEALVRWEHPQRGLILPGEFIPIAEETDLILSLGRWVLAEACRQMAVWQKKFAMDPPLTISVNVSFRQLMEPGLVDDVKRVLAESGLRPGTLRLEMTESTIMTNADDAIDALRRLKEMNVGLEIDDFGTGYSSLSHLNRLPFDTLKIDRSFVRELVSGESSEIVVAILKVAHSLGMSVITEGIENAEQLQLLTELGCNYGQGYYFARPLAPEAAQALIESRESVSAALVPAGAFAENLEHEAVPVGV